MPPAPDTSDRVTRSASGGATPRVSVIMSVLDPDLGFLRIAIDSVLTQDFDDFELIVLEDPRADGSTPGEQLLAPIRDKRVRYIRNTEAMPLDASRKKTLELARSKLVAILDADDACRTDRLSAQVAFLDAHPEIDLVGSALEAIDENGKTLGFRSYPLEPDAVRRTMPRFNPIAHPTVMLRRDAVLAAGDYGGGLSGLSTCDDYDLWSRMARRGSEIANLPEPLVRYRIHRGATKSRLLRATLRDTVHIKQYYWRESFGLGDRIRLWAERGLQLVPAPVVTRMFMRRTFRPSLPKSPRG